MLRLPAACCRVDLAWTMLCLAPRAHRVRFPNVRALCVERFVARVALEHPTVSA